VFVVAYFVLPRGAWDVSETAPARPLLLLPWAAGFVAYQLTLPTYFADPGAGWTTWWTARQADLGIDPANGCSASLISLAVAAVLTAAVCLPGAVRAHRAGVGR
jgi:NCS1 family nucleobase:cation symporter-1